MPWSLTYSCAHPGLENGRVAVAIDLVPACELAYGSLPAVPSPPSLNDDSRKRRRQAKQHLGGGVAKAVGPILIPKPQHVGQALLDHVQTQERGAEIGGDSGPH